MINDLSVWSLSKVCTRKLLICSNKPP